MEITRVLKAIADETRYNIIILLLQHNYCVRALSEKLEMSESAISQHIRVLKETGLVTGVKKGYFMHYNVERDMLRKLATQIHELSKIERKTCNANPSNHSQNCSGASGSCCQKGEGV
ncbi:MAG: winged helix-turn-helix transcriptional regulator [Clostridiaceae bacterium]|mgnify:CR=1 FL=1|nr:winged helix-turn-helix transcriptional regulator [Clostridiaceae bacterium]